MGCGNGKEDNAQEEAPNLPLLRKSVKKEGGFTDAQFVIAAAGALSEAYDMDQKKIGEGSYGTVCKGKCKRTQDIRAIKAVSKAQMKNIVRFRQEIAIMKIMVHPNIVKLHEYYEDLKQIYLVMELAEGGELFDRIVEVSHFTESQAACLMQQIFRATFYMHENHICHRDLKPENFLFMNKAPIEQSCLKIIDFGLSTPFEPGQVLKTKAGTPYYVAPQVLQGKYDELSDLWSCGVIMYVLLCGYPPFYGNDDGDVLNKVKQGKYSFHPKDWSEISADAKQLIGGLLKMNPKERLTAEGALHHVWVEHKAPKASNAPIAKTLITNLRTFKAKSQMKKVALHIIAAQLNEGQIKELRDTFTALDANGDGMLTVTEMKESFGKAGITEIPVDLQETMESIDCDGDGVVNYTEFVAAALDHRAYIEEHACWSAFRLFDTDGDGKISQKELESLLGHDNVLSVAGGQESVERILNEVDGNHDGVIDFDEFMTMMREVNETLVKERTKSAIDAKEVQQ